MEKKLARKILKAGLAFDKPLGRLDSLVGEIPNKAERAIYLRALGKLMQDINNNFIRRIAREYPDLDPDPL